MLVAVHAQATALFGESRQKAFYLRGELRRRLPPERLPACAPGQAPQSDEVMAEHAAFIDEQRDVGCIGAAGAFDQVQVHAKAKGAGFYAGACKLCRLAECGTVREGACAAQPFRPVSPAPVDEREDGARLRDGDAVVVSMQDHAHAAPPFVASFLMQTLVITKPARGRFMKNARFRRRQDPGDALAPPCGLLPSEYLVNIALRNS